MHPKNLKIEKAKASSVRFSRLDNLEELTAYESLAVVLYDYLEFRV